MELEKVYQIRLANIQSGCKTLSMNSTYVALLTMCWIYSLREGNTLTSEKIFSSMLILQNVFIKELILDQKLVRYLF